MKTGAEILEEYRNQEQDISTFVTLEEMIDQELGAARSVNVDQRVSPACDETIIKLKAKIMENKYWLNFLNLDATNIIHKSCLEDRITELETIHLIA